MHENSILYSILNVLFQVITHDVMQMQDKRVNTLLSCSSNYSP